MSVIFSGFLKSGSSQLPAWLVRDGAARLRQPSDFGRFVRRRQAARGFSVSAVRLFVFLDFPHGSSRGPPSRFLLFLVFLGLSFPLLRHGLTIPFPLRPAFMFFLFRTIPSCIIHSPWFLSKLSPCRIPNLGNSSFLFSALRINFLSRYLLAVDSTIIASRVLPKSCLSRSPSLSRLFVLILPTSIHLSFRYSPLGRLS